MYGHESHTKSQRPAGYLALLTACGFKHFAWGHRSYVGNSSSFEYFEEEHVKVCIYPSRYWPGEGIGAQLEFALKYDGIQLAVLVLLFEKLTDDILAYIQSKPTGKYARRIWFLYEFLTGRALPLDNIKRGNYVELLDSDRYFTIQPGEYVSRQRVINNLLGDQRFCPIVQRSKRLEEFQSAQVGLKFENAISSYPPEMLRRALSFAYLKETKSSFEIEQIRPQPSKVDRFVAMLHLAGEKDYCATERLIELQNLIVDPRYCEARFRQTQNYVGETLPNYFERIHYVCPKPEDLDALMAGWLFADRRMAAGKLDPVIHAAVTSYGFVYLHPFEDGNGRIHRFLIHHILARREFMKKGTLFPVSAVMLHQPTDYNLSLEAFSTKLLQQVDYELDREGHMKLLNQTATWYRYPDYTAQAEALYFFIEKAIDLELQELAFLSRYDDLKSRIEAIVDFPARQLDLLLKTCLANGGRLSKRKRESHFSHLTDDEIATLEQVILGLSPQPGIPAHDLPA